MKPIKPTVKMSLTEKEYKISQLQMCIEHQKLMMRRKDKSISPIHKGKIKEYELQIKELS